MNTIFLLHNDGGMFNMFCLRCLSLTLLKWICDKTFPDVLGNAVSYHIQNKILWFTTSEMCCLVNAYKLIFVFMQTSGVV